MAHGYVNLIHDKQTGPRGDDKTFSQSMLMLMGQRPTGPGRLGLRAMLSLDPTQGKSGYPLLFQAGETADGENAPRRSPASARSVHGATRLPTACRSARRVPPSCTSAARASRRSVHRPSCIASRACAIPEAPLSEPSLARLDPHHLRRGDGGRQPRAAPARRLLVQRPRAGSAPLEHRDAKVRLLVERGFPTTPCPSSRCSSATAT